MSWRIWLPSRLQNGEGRAVSDDKRYLRQLKRDIKKAGNRKKRRYLKDPSADPSDFDYGRKRSDVMNERPRNGTQRETANE